VRSRLRFHGFAILSPFRSLGGRGNWEFEMFNPAPGPYSVTGQSEGGKYIKVGDVNGRTIARVPFSPSENNATDNDTAHVLAASHQMLVALHRLADAAFARDVTMGDPITLLNVKAELAAATVAARAAIAKAEGRETEQNARLSYGPGGELY
jgi:hypothetical protein